MHVVSFLQAIFRFACYFPRGGSPLFKILMLIFVSLWILGLLTGHMMGGFIHVLLVLALVLWLITLVQGEKR